MTSIPVDCALTDLTTIQRLLGDHGWNAVGGVHCMSASLLAGHDDHPYMIGVDWVRADLDTPWRRRTVVTWLHYDQPDRDGDATTTTLVWPADRPIEHALNLTLERATAACGIDLRETA